MTAQLDEADRALKSKHRAMWALGDYPSVSADLLGELAPALVQAASVGPDDRVLDVGAGPANVAIAAAQAGARVVASDLTPQLLDRGRVLAAAAGLEIEWREADAEALPFGDDEFDAVLSSVGVMFAPHHQAAADELVRVCRPGGRIALANWTPQGFIGQMFATMKPYAAPPPPGASPPPLWGDEAHVRELFGDRVSELSLDRRLLRITRFGSPEEFREFFKQRYGPTIAAYRYLGDDTERVAGLDADLLNLAALHGWEEHGRFVMDWEYLVVSARTA